MEILAFVGFFTLVLAWFVAPSGEVAPAAAPVPPPTLTPGEAGA